MAWGDDTEYKTPLQKERDTNRKLQVELERLTQRVAALHERKPDLRPGLKRALEICDKVSLLQWDGADVRGEAAADKCRAGIETEIAAQGEAGD